MIHFTQTGRMRVAPPPPPPPPRARPRELGESASSAYMPRPLLPGGSSGRFTMCCFLLLMTLAVSLLSIGHTASRELFPCQPQSIKFNVSLYYSDTLVVLANSSFCGSAFQPYSVSNPYKSQGRFMYTPY